MCVISHFSRVRLFATLWTVAHQASLSIGFSRKEYWSGLLCPPPGNLPDPGIKPSYLSCLADRFVTICTTCEALKILSKVKQCSILTLKMEIKWKDITQKEKFMMMEFLKIWQLDLFGTVVLWNCWVVSLMQSGICKGDIDSSTTLRHKWWTQVHSHCCVCNGKRIKQPEWLPPTDLPLSVSLLQRGPRVWGRD